MAKKSFGNPGLVADRVGKPPGGSRAGKLDGRVESAEPERADIKAPALLKSPEQVEARPNLIYTLCLDAPGAEGQRFLAKMFVSSLLRTYFSGDIVVFRNSPHPLFRVERKGLEEVYLDTEDLTGQQGAEKAWCYKYLLAEGLDVRGYDKVAFFDSDMLALRNIDHLFEGDWDIAYQPEWGHPGDEGSYRAFYTDNELAAAAKRTGVNSGSLAVRAGVFHDVMREWRRIDEGKRRRDEGFWDQASWNKLLLTKSWGSGGGRKSKVKPWHAEPFPSREIMFPLYLDPHYLNYREAAMTHNCGGDTLIKIECTFGLYMRTFFCDPTGLYFNMLEM